MIANLRGRRLSVRLYIWPLSKRKNDSSAGRSSVSYPTWEGSGSAVGVKVIEMTHTRTAPHTKPQWLKVQFQWPWVSVSAAPTPSSRCGPVECEPFSPGSRGGIQPVIPHWWMRNITALGDRCHRRLKAPASGSEKNGSGERKEKGNCCCRTSKHKPCRESRCETSGEAEGRERVLQVERRQMARGLFGFLLFFFSSSSSCF